MVKLHRYLFVLVLTIWFNAGTPPVGLNSILALCID